MVFTVKVLYVLETFTFNIYVTLADVGVLKNTSSSLLWTTEADRTHSLSQHSAASSKKPAFSLSAFGGMFPVSTAQSFFQSL